MRIKQFTLALAAACTLTANAQNTKTTVDAVAEDITLMSDVDYVIESDKPFVGDAVVNIANLDHAVVIIKNVKPSTVTKSLMSHILINGEKAIPGDLTSKNATAGSNCQVKMYNRGTIIMPYGQDFRPLTCYTEKDFEGESCDEYTEGSAGGFMKNLTSSTLNNNIKSFKLKRGYMVTFALGKSGWGYSRCFIADTEDIEVNLPTNMAGKISSYRLFKWWDASKAGVHDTSAACNSALRTTSCFDWAQGNSSLLPDVEWVPNHIYEDWPSAGTCGSVDGSCHMKTNNEPGNSADDHPQSVEEVLNNWQNLMRTGMRLCSESSHDGSMGHLKTFIEEIDKRGWRCDILDLHSYWTGQFNNFDWYRSEYGKGRPIWISEWVYGSSWGNAGIFKECPDGRDSYSTKNQQKNYDLVKPVLDILNSKDYIERYFYWNSEADCSKIYKGGQISILGKYYASMETGLAYNKKYDYIPKVVYSDPTDLEGTYSKARNEFKLSWKDTNGDMLDSLVIQYKGPGTSTWKHHATVTLQDINGKDITYNYTVYPETGANYYRVAAYPAGSRTPRFTNETSISVSGIQGNEKVQYGTLSMANTDPVTSTYKTAFETVPSVFMTTITNNNTELWAGNLITSAGKSKFNYQILPGTSMTETSLTKAEETAFIAMQNGNYKYGKMDCEIGEREIDDQLLEVTFDKPFPEGVTPIVITELRNSILKKYPISVRVFDVTNTGFKALAMYEETTSATINTTITMSYMAVTPGLEVFDEELGLLIAAGGNTEVKGSSAGKVEFIDPRGNGEELLYLDTPLFFSALQTYNYKSATVLRRGSDLGYIVDDENDSHNGLQFGVRVKRTIDGRKTDADGNRISSTTPDNIGWIIISKYNENGSLPSATEEDPDDPSEEPDDPSEDPDDPSEDPDDPIDVAIKAVNTSDAPYVSNGKIVAKGTYEVFNAAGTKIDGKSALSTGIYFVRKGSNTYKIIVK